MRIAFKILLAGAGLFVAVTKNTAQSDSLFATLPVTTVSAAPLRSGMTGELQANIGTALQALPTALNFAELLPAVGGVFLKNYGPGTLATLSIRGASAQQTAIFWNGVPLQSPMAGLNDVTLIPAQWIDDAAVHYGAAGAQWGSGAVGGTITFAQKIPEKKGLRLQLKAQTGSFAAQHYQTAVQYRHTKWALGTRLFYGKAVNDFPWSTQPNLPLRKQTNAAQHQKGLLQELWWMPARRHQLALHTWIQNNDRQIPPLSTQTRSSATQADHAYRNTLQWRYVGAVHLLQAKAAWFSERIDYRERVDAIPALSHFQTAFAEMEDEWALSKHWRAQIGSNLTHAQATADGYREGVSEWRTALFANMRRENKQWRVHLALRQEWIGNQNAPFLPGAGVSWQPFSRWTFNARVNRHYRLPTLNDRFWQPGGNTRLQPEQGWSEEVSWVTQMQKWLRWESAAYHRLMRDWILWSQAPGQLFWSSNNIASVRSYGVEQRLHGHFQTGAISWRLTMSYDYTRSVNQKAVSRPLISEGAQLWYVPVHQAAAAIVASWRDWRLSYQHRYTGQTIGFGENLAAFDLGIAQFQYGHKATKFPFTAFFQMDNLWNVSYRVVEKRPMPGRSWTIGCSMQRL